ncbi:MAG: hypothetical protein Q8R15_00310 [Candidatus Micrarchaeota archaeon]|nr:hypothetical protein [Candidatus Micrarchaeota archaeon]
MAFEGNRKIRLVFNFGGHNSAADARAVAPVLKRFKPHVVCIEAAEGSDRVARALEVKYLRGEPMGDDSFNLALIKTLRKQGVQRIHLLERFSDRAAEKYGKRMEEAKEVQASAYDAFGNGNPDKAIMLHIRAIKLYSEAINDRETAIKLGLGNLHQVLSRKYPELASEGEIRVVVNYGAGHTPIYRSAKQMGFKEVTRAISLPHYYPLSGAQMRISSFGIQGKLTADDVARGMLASVIAKAADRAGASISHANAFGNLAVKNVTLKQFRRMSSEVASTGNFGRMLKKEGIPIPRSARQVRKFLQSKRIPVEPTWLQTTLTTLRQKLRS